MIVVSILMHSLAHSLQKAHSDIVRTLLAAGADPCAVDSQGRTPFQLAKDSNVKDVYVSEIFQAVGKNK